MEAQASSKTQSPADESALRAAIDRSVRWPVLFFFASATIWLLASLAAGFVANYRLASPGGPDSWAALSFPRLQPAHFSMLVYGWGFNMAFGVMLWLMARLTRQEAKGIFSFLAAGKVWNMFVFVGTVFVLAGQGTGVEWLEFPRWCWPVLFVSYGVIAAKLFVLFQRRPDRESYISIHYLVAALFAFPWLLLTAWVFIFSFPGAAVMSTAINLWYVGGLQALFFTPVALAAIGYFIPKITGNPLPATNLAVGGFWGMIAVGAWTGLGSVVGGPFPAWLPVLSAAASFLLIFPAIIVFRDFFGAVKGQGGALEFSPTLRFTFASLWAFLVVVALGAFLAYNSGAAAFSTAIVGQGYATVLGFFGMAVFGAMAFIMPRITECEWPSGKTLLGQFWFTVYSVIMLVFLSVAGGLMQSAAVSDVSAGWRVVVEGLQPYIVGRLFAFVVLLGVNLIFLRSFALMLLRLAKPAGLATLLHEPAPEADSSASASAKA